MKPDIQRSAIAARAKKPASKIDRSAFLYMVDHDGDADEGDDFAQCGDCRFFSPDKRCAVLGIPVKATWSCGLFVDGDYTGEIISKTVTPEEAGVYKGSVRCENCRFGGSSRCGLYERLNTDLPAIFDLDTKIDPKGCCNGFQPKTG